MTKPRFVQNNKAGDHAQALADVLKDATQISVAVAFLKARGLEQIMPSLKVRLAAGAKIEMFVGSDWCTTHPRALKDLLTLRQKHRSLLEVFLAKPDAKSTFHPKVYLNRPGIFGGLIALQKGALSISMNRARFTGGIFERNE